MRLARGSAWATAATSAAVLVILAVVLVPWDWVPGGTLRPAGVSDLFTADQVARAEDYSATRRGLAWGSYAVSLLVAGVLGFTPLGARLVRRAGARLPWWAAVPAAVLVVLAIGRVATLGLAVARHRHDLAFGLTEQSWTGWAGDQGRSLGVSWLMTALAALALVAVARRFPRRWFLGGGALAAGLVLAGSFLYPVLVEPVFNRFEPMPPGELRASVLALAERQGVDVDEVLVADASRRTTTLNAYVSGFGGTRRVVVYDTLLEGVPDDQVWVVVAHELAHARHHDVLVGTMLGALGTVTGISLLALALDSPRLRRRAGVPGAGDPTVVPVALALVAAGGLLAAPLQSGISRAVEMRADREALAVTGDARTFVGMQRELALASLADPTPPDWSQLWFGSHPTVLERAGLPASLEAAR